MPQTLDITRMLTTEPAADDDVLPGLPAGYAGGIISSGGSGKTFWALEAAALIGAGVDLMGIGAEYASKGKVKLFLAEDGPHQVHKRLHALGAYLNNEQREAFAGNIEIQDWTKDTPDLLHAVTRGVVEKAIEGARLCFLDTLRSFHLGDENSTKEMSLLIGYLRGMAARTGCSIVYLHHVNKAAVASNTTDQASASRGASTLIDNVRWCMFLSNMRPEEAQEYGIRERGYWVRQGMAKQNYGPPIAERWLKRAQGGILVEAPPLAKPEKKKGKERGKG